MHIFDSNKLLGNTKKVQQLTKAIVKNWTIAYPPDMFLKDGANLITTCVPNTEDPVSIRISIKCKATRIQQNVITIASASENCGLLVLENAYIDHLNKEILDCLEEIFLSMGYSYLMYSINEHQKKMRTLLSACDWEPIDSFYNRRSENMCEIFSKHIKDKV